MQSHLRIATEEAWAPRHLLERYRKLLQSTPAAWDPGFHSLWGHFLGTTPRATALAARIQDLGEGRLRDMDASGIARQLLLLTAPGVQVFDAPTGSALARETNDELAQHIVVFFRRRRNLGLVSFRGVIVILLTAWAAAYLGGAIMYIVAYRPMSQIITNIK